jgi:DNA helicase HerA-like ATPase
MPQAADFERLGSFYLGRTLRADGRVGEAPLLYDAKDLTTHAVCLGMTGSGKTGLCVSLLEEAAIDGIPAIAIDPKGDLGNLLLGFPSLSPEEFRPWIDETEAAQAGRTPDEHARATAELWKQGLADWGQDPVDLDYKALGNAGTWFLGRLQTERDQARVLEGLEAAFQAETASLRAAAGEGELAELRIRPRKSDTQVERVALVWQPYWVGADGSAQPGFASPA